MIPKSEMRALAELAVLEAERSLSARVEAEGGRSVVDATRAPGFWSDIKQDTRHYADSLANQRIDEGAFRVNDGRALRSAVLGLTAGFAGIGAVAFGAPHAIALPAALAAQCLALGNMLYRAALAGVSDKEQQSDVRGVTEMADDLLRAKFPGKAEQAGDSPKAPAAASLLSSPLGLVKQFKDAILGVSQERQDAERFERQSNRQSNW